MQQPSQFFLLGFIGLGLVLGVLIAGIGWIKLKSIRRALIGFGLYLIPFTAWLCWFLFVGVPSLLGFVAFAVAVGIPTYHLVMRDLKARQSQR